MSNKMKVILYKYRYIMILLIVVALLAMATPKFFSVNNFMNILWAVAIVGIISMGGTFVILVGKIDLSVGNIAALAGITSALMLKSNYSIALSVLSALAVGGTAGAINGIFVSKLKVPPFITTLAVGSILTGIAQMASDGKTISILEQKQYVFLGSGKILGIPCPVFGFGLVFLISFFILNKTVYGRKCYLAGGNPRAARISNIAVGKIVILAYVICGIAASFGGVMLTALNQQANATTANGYELDVIATVVIGGTSMNGGVGTVQGTVFGVILIGLINNGLNLLSVSGSWHPVVKGIIIIAAVAFNNVSVKFMRSMKEDGKQAAA